MLAIFDLDGTLIDSKLDLAHAVNATMREQGRAELEFERIYSYVGDGAPTLMRRAFGEGTDEATLAAALEFFLVYYRAHKLDYTVMYEGIPELLAALAADGLQMAVLTNKPVRISEEIVKELGIAHYFARVYGGNSFGQKKPDPVGIATLMGELGEARGSTVMIGDSHVDIETAKNAGVASIGVLYGFHPDGVRAAGADVLVDTAGEVLEQVRLMRINASRL